MASRGLCTTSIGAPNSDLLSEPILMKIYLQDVPSGLRCHVKIITNGYLVFKWAVMSFPLPSNRKIFLISHGDGFLQDIKPPDDGYSSCKPNSDNHLHLLPHSLRSIGAPLFPLTKNGCVNTKYGAISIHAFTASMMDVCPNPS